MEQSRASRPTFAGFNRNTGVAQHCAKIRVKKSIFGDEVILAMQCGAVGYSAGCVDAGNEIACAWPGVQFSLNGEKSRSTLSRRYTLGCLPGDGNHHIDQCAITADDFAHA